MRGNVKKICLVLAMFLLISVFSGCGGSTTTTQSSSSSSETTTAQATSTTKAKENITFTYSFWGTGTEVKSQQSIIAAYQKLNPNVRIKETYTDGGNYPVKLQTYFASNSAPDVMAMCSDSYTDWEKNGIFYDLSSYIKTNNLQDLYTPEAIKAFEVNGKQIGIPYAADTYCIAYNKKLFDQAKIAYPKSDWTETQFIDCAKSLTTGTGVNKIFGMFFSWYSSEMITDFYGKQAAFDQANNKVFIKGNDTFKHAVSFLADCINTYKISPDANDSKNITGGFETGRYAMAIVADWDIGSLQKTIGSKFDWDVVEMPTSEFGNWSVAERVLGLTISSKSSKKDAGCDFIKWFTSDAESLKLVTSAATPVLTSFIKDEYLSFYPSEWLVHYNKQVFVNMQSRTRPHLWMGNWNKAATEINNQMALYILGKQSLDKSLDNMQANCDNIFAGKK